VGNPRRVTGPRGAVNGRDNDGLMAGQSASAVPLGRRSSRHWNAGPPHV